MSSERYASHASGTAVCVDLALDSVEHDLLVELDSARGHTAAALERVLARVRARRKAMAELISSDGKLSEHQTH